MAGLISDWLNEADEEDRKTRVGERVAEMETRAFRMEETDRIQLNKSKDASGNSGVEDKKSGAVGSAKTAESVPETSAEATPSETESKDTRDRSTPGSFTRHASPKNVAPKDTQEAAAQTLRKFFNRGG
jgi:hypothetical protein